MNRFEIVFGNNSINAEAPDAAGLLTILRNIVLVLERNGIDQGMQDIASAVAGLEGAVVTERNNQ